MHTHCLNNTLKQLNRLFIPIIMHDTVTLSETCLTLPGPSFGLILVGVFFLHSPATSRKQKTGMPLTKMKFVFKI